MNRKGEIDWNALLFMIAIMAFMFGLFYVLVFADSADCHAQAPYSTPYTREDMERQKVENEVMDKQILRRGDYQEAWI